MDLSEKNILWRQCGSVLVSNWKKKERKCGGRQCSKQPFYIFGFLVQMWNSYHQALGWHIDVTHKEEIQARSLPTALLWCCPHTKRILSEKKKSCWLEGSWRSCLALFMALPELPLWLLWKSSSCWQWRRVHHLSNWHHEWAVMENRIYFSTSLASWIYCEPFRY